ncbi:hypothetical protein Trydic_g4515 [Trypoxylus dichotomus]
MQARIGSIKIHKSPWKRIYKQGKLAEWQVNDNYCKIRKDTWNRLLHLSGGALKEKLKLMPDIRNFVTDDHLDALERRLLIVYAAIEFCMSVNKEKPNIL